MNLYDYQEQAHKTAIYPTDETLLSPAQIYSLMGNGGETGELLNLCKKALRGDYGQDPVINVEFRKKLVGELGGQLWYLAEVCSVFGLELNEVAQANLELLADRQERGVLKGSGDNR